ncbi:hypothetical protein SVIOM342S_00519 [Streptomyces violaceorubidus]
MTISQGGTGSGASGPAVRNIYDALYGLAADGNQDPKKALLPKPQTSLPKIQTDGTILAPKMPKDVVNEPRADEKASRRTQEAAPVEDRNHPATTPTRTGQPRTRRHRRRGGARRGTRRGGDGRSRMAHA